MTINVTISSPALGSECRMADYLANAFLTVDTTVAFTSIAPTEVDFNTSSIVLGSNISLKLTGNGLSFDAVGHVTGGTITEIRVIASPPNAVVSTATGLSINAAQLFDAIETAQFATIDALLFQSDSFTYTGDAGSDTFTGGTFGDTIVGDAGSDSLNGGGGNDIITGGDGADILNGGAGGSDTVSYAGSAMPVNIDLAAGKAVNGVDSDVLSNFENVVGSDSDDDITGDAGDNILTGGKGADNIFGGGGFDTASYAGSSAAVSVNLLTGIATGGDAQDDLLASIQGLIGSDFNDTLVGDGDYSFLSGGKGADSLAGGDGDDEIIGGAGADTIDGGAGIDILYYDTSASGVSLTLGLAGAVAVGAGTGSDALGDKVSNIENVSGSNFNDTLTGNELANAFFGNSGNDVIKANLGDDTIYGDAGNDNLDGGAGNDLLFGGDGADTLVGGDGIDTASYAIASAAVAVNLGGAPGTGTQGSAKGDTLTTIENLIGSDYADILTGNALANVIEGGAGADTLTGGGGNDTLSYRSSFGGVGVTLIANAAASTSLDALGDVATGFANIIGGHLADNLTGDSGDNIIEGGGGNDILDGGTNGLKGDTLSYAGSGGGIDVKLKGALFALIGSGGLGNDATGDLASNFENVLGSASDDVIWGDANANSLASGAGNDTLQGGLGNDTLDGGAGSGDWVSFDDATAGVSLTLGLNGAAANISGGGAGYGIDSILNIENILGSAGNDTLIGNALDNIIEGNGGSDSLDGGVGIDTVSFRSETGSVAVNLKTSATTIKNFEIVIGGQAADSITGSDGANIIDGYFGSDTLDGGAGNDTVSFATAHSGVTLTLGAVSGLSDILESSAVQVAETDSIKNFENIIGSALDDSFGGNTGANTIQGGAGDDTIEGGGGADSLSGGDGNDAIGGGSAIETIDGGAGADNLFGSLGADSLSGGAGVDVVDYSVDVASIIITLGKDGAVATAASGAGLSQGDKLSGIENIVGGSGSDSLTGNNLDNELIGDVGDDTIQGGAGADTLSGGANTGKGDTLSYSLSLAGVDVNLDTNSAKGGDAQGDSILGFENLIGSGGNDTLAGGNSIDGGAGDDVVRGGAGADTLIGGLNVLGGTGDTLSYETDSTGVDVKLNAALAAIINAGQLGNDAVGDVASGFENLRGGSGDDTLVGDGLNNIIEGGAGADSLDGGLGLDTLSYRAAAVGVFVDLLGTASDGEAAGDLIANFENVIGGTGADTLIGSVQANVVTGGEGGDLINGRGGADTLDGGAGIDTVSYISSTAAVNVSLLTNTGTGGDATGDKLSGFENIVGSISNDTLTGNAGANELTGGLGNDKLDGAGGADTLIGSDGNDSYVVDSSSDQVVESAGEGTADAILASVSYTLAAGQEIEQLALATGTAALNLKGNEFNNTITGNAGNNIIEGGAGADSMLGGGGIDTLSYRGDSVGVNITLNAGVATIVNTSSDADNDKASGFANLLGGSAADTLTGDLGANVIEGGAGGDSLTGGLGIDTLSYAGSAAGVSIDLSTSSASGGDAAGDTITGFENILGSEQSDSLTGDGIGNVLTGGGGSDFVGGGGGADTVSAGAGNDTVIGGAGADSLDGGAGVDTIDYSSSGVGVTVSLNVAISSGAGPVGSDAIGDKLTNFENVVGTAFSDTLQGSSVANIINGGDGNDSLDGAVGADTLIGGTGNDTFVVDSAGDVIVESFGEGSDRILASVSYTLADTADIELLVLGGTGAINAIGNIFENSILGNTGANVLTGGGGSDTLDGAAGIDTVFYGNDTDAISVNLATGFGAGGSAEGDVLLNIENVTGGSGNDTLIGNALANLLSGGAGNDVLIGGSLADTLDGGAGNADTASYANATAGVVVNLGLAGGKQVGAGDVTGDVLISIENITGSSFDDTLTGDTSANLVTGGDGNDVLTGGGGADTLAGGTGNDVYVVGDALDTISEASGGGIDTVQAGLSYTLANGSNVENLALAVGTANLDGTGNDADNLITGNAGANKLDGGLGNDTLIGALGADTLIGGGGNDVFGFSTTSGLDVIQGFESGAGLGDRIDLSSITTFTSFAQILSATTQVGLDSVIKLTTDGKNTITLAGVDKNTLFENDFIFNSTAQQAPTDITITNASVFENVAPGTVVGALGAVDPEGGTFTFTLRDGSFGRFGISGNNLVVNGGLDYATNQTLNIIVRVTDSTGLTYDETLTITIKQAGPITGTSGNDNLNGSFRSEKFFGLDGNDYFSGRGGNDTYDGGLGNDIVSYFEDGTAGITVNLSDPIKNTGSAKGDVFISIESVRGTKFNDLLVGDSQNNFLRGGPGADTLDGAGGSDYADYRNASQAVIASLTDPSTNTGEAQGDVYISIERLRGGEFNDTLIGDNGDFTAQFGASVPGNVLDGYIGGDQLIGMGGGADFAGYTSASAAVKADLNVGNDTAKAATFNTGDAKGDTYIGIEGLWGSDFNDTLIGDANDNILVGWKGADVLNGGAGNDTAAYYANAIFGTIGVTASLSNPALNTGDAVGDTYVSIENLFGTPFADVLIGDSNANKLTGDGGNDVLQGLGGSDTLDGGNGNDIASYAEGTAGVFADLSNNTESLVVVNTNTGAAAGDRYVSAGGISNIEGLRGSKFDDTLVGDSGNNILIGGDGADSLVGGAGNDFADYRFSAFGLKVNLGNTSENTGEAAGDSYSSIERLRGSNFNDTLIGNNSGNNLDGGSGADVLDGGSTLGGADFDFAQYSSSQFAIQVSLGDPSLNTGDAVGDVFISIEGLWGSNFNDTLIGSAANDEILMGSSGADVLDGGGGTNNRAAYFSSTTAVNIDLADPTKNTGDGVGDTYIGIQGLIGGDKNDTLKGDSGNNRLEGRQGDDILMGRGGADTFVGDRATSTGDTPGIDLVSYAESTTGFWADLINKANNTGEAAGDSYQKNSGDAFNSIEGFIGGSGNDTLVGDGNANILIGGLGADSLSGGIGSDTADYRFATTGVLVSLSAPGTNTGEAAGDIYNSIENLTGGAFNDTLEGTAGNNSFDGGAGFDLVSYVNSAGSVEADLQLKVFAGSGDDYVDVEGLIGSSNNDTLGGDAGDNILVGGAGNDTLTGRGGKDILIGGAGADTLNGNTPSDGDIASYEDAASGVYADLQTEANNTGDAFGDTYSAIVNLRGSQSGDTLVGNTFFDGTLEGLGGADSLLGGDGNDTLIGGAGADSMDGGDSPTGDLASYETAAALNDGFGHFIVGVTADLDGTNTNTGDAAGDTYLDIENLRGSQFNDRLFGNVDGNLIEGLAGDDFLAGRAGNDTLDGGNGNDTISYSLDIAGVKVNLGDAAENTGAAAGDAYISIENVVSGSGNDTLIGTAANNVFTGGAGADSIDGGAGFDTASYFNATSGVQVRLADPTKNTGDAAGDVFVSIENLSGSDGWGDLLVGDAGNNRIFGNGGNDTLGSNGGNDVLDGGAGNDIVSFKVIPATAGTTGAIVNLGDSNQNGGLAGGLVLVSIEGVYGSPNADRLTGDNNDNIFFGSAGADTINGGGLFNDFDTVSFADSTAAVTASLFNSVNFKFKAVGNTGGDAAGDNFGFIEHLVGSNFNDTLYGGAFGSVTEGGLGNDYIGLLGAGSFGIGGAGADTIEGDFASGTASYATSAVGPGNLGVVIDLANPLNNTGDAAGDKLININWVVGSAGNDTIIGATQLQMQMFKLEGGAGDDVIISNQFGQDLIGGAGADELHGFAGQINVASYETALSGVYVDLLNTANNTGDAVGDTYFDLNRLKGSKLNDTLIASNAEPAVLYSFDGDDSLVGSTNSFDMFDGGAGKDTMDGVSGGFDAVSYGSAKSGMTISLLNEAINTGDAAGDHYINISSIFAGEFDDVVIGDGNNNSLWGGSGRDSIDGGDGNDQFRGQLGNDTLTGGDGSDTFLFEQPSEGVDIITDFVSGTDLIQAGATQPTDTFGFIGLLASDYPFPGLEPGGGWLLKSSYFVSGSGAGAVANVSGHGQFIFDTTDAAHHLLYWDKDGTGTAQKVLLADMLGASLVASDILVL